MNENEAILIDSKGNLWNPLLEKIFGSLRKLQLQPILSSSDHGVVQYAAKLGVLIREDLSSKLAQMYLEEFPLKCEYIPANGLVHTYIQKRGKFNGKDFSIASNANIAVFCSQSQLRDESDEVLRECVKSIAALNLDLCVYGETGTEGIAFDGILKMGFPKDLLEERIESAVKSEHSSVKAEMISEASKQTPKMAYLGFPHPQIIEIPITFNEVKSSILIMFLMNGLVIEDFAI